MSDQYDHRSQRPILFVVMFAFSLCANGGADALLRWQLYPRSIADQARGRSEAWQHHAQYEARGRSDATRDTTAARVVVEARYLI
jgi:hypothetical protein